MKKIVFGFLCTLLAIFASLGLCEIIFTFYNPFPVDKSWDFSRGIPGPVNVRHPREEGYPFAHTNYRILALGDSFTYGVQLQTSDTWPKKTQEYLRKDGYPDLEIINVGIPSTDTADQYEFFIDEAYRYKPDMVIIGFLMNDVTDLCLTCGAAALKIGFEDFKRKTEANKKFGTRTLHYLNLAYIKHVLTKKTVSEYNQAYEDDAPGLQRCQKAFLRFKELSQKHRFRLIVVMYPMLYQLNKDHPFKHIYRKMETFFKQAGIEAYDLTPVFYGYKDTDLWVTSADSHPNAKANTIAAKRIAEIVKGHLRE